MNDNLAYGANARAQAFKLIYTLHYPVSNKVVLKFASNTPRSGKTMHHSDHLLERFMPRKQHQCYRASQSFAH